MSIEEKQIREMIRGFDELQESYSYGRTNRQPTLIVREELPLGKRAWHTVELSRDSAEFIERMAAMVAREVCRLLSLREDRELTADENCSLRRSIYHFSTMQRELMMRAKGEGKKQAAENRRFFEAARRILPSDVFEKVRSESEVQP